MYVATAKAKIHHNLPFYGLISTASLLLSFLLSIIDCRKARLGWWDHHRKGEWASGKDRDENDVSGCWDCQSR